MNIPHKKLTKYNLDCAYTTEKNTVIRGHGWTTNGFYLIRTQYECPILTKLTTATKPMPDHVNDYIPKHDLKPIYYHDMDTTITNSRQEPYIAIFKDALGCEVKLNIYFVNLFLRCGFEITFEYTSPFKQVVVKNADTQEVIGVIMPIRI